MSIIVHKPQFNEDSIKVNDVVMFKHTVYTGRRNDILPDTWYVGTVIKVDPFAIGIGLYNDGCSQSLTIELVKILNGEFCLFNVSRLSHDDVKVGGNPITNPYEYKNIWEVRDDLPTKKRRSPENANNF